MNKQTRYSPEVRERAVPLVFEHASKYSSQYYPHASTPWRAAPKRSSHGERSRNAGYCISQ